MSPRTLLCLCALSCAAWIGGVAAGCTSGTTPDCMGDAGCGPGFDGPPPETASPDAPSETTPDAVSDVTPDVVSDRGQDVGQDVVADVPAETGGAPCHKLGGKLDAGTFQCTYDPNATSCTGKPGSCPAKNLDGCCVAADGTAVCYYTGDVPDAAVEQTMCTADAGSTWVTTAP